MPASHPLSMVPNQPPARRPALLLLAAAALVLAGCGQKGDLYLPDEDEKSSRVSHASPSVA